MWHEQTDPYKKRHRLSRQKKEKKEEKKVIPPI
jgi:elongation factor P--beta-lysine ligase